MKKIVTAATPVKVTIKAMNKAEVQKIIAKMKSFGYTVDGTREKTLDFVKEAPPVYVAHLRFGDRSWYLTLATSKEGSDNYITALEVEIMPYSVGHDLGGFAKKLADNYMTKGEIKQLYNSVGREMKVLDTIEERLLNLQAAVEFLGQYCGDVKGPK